MEEKGQNRQQQAPNMNPGMTRTTGNNEDRQRSETGSEPPAAKGIMNTEAERELTEEAGNGRNAKARRDPATEAEGSQAARNQRDPTAKAGKGSPDEAERGNPTKDGRDKVSTTAPQVPQDQGSRTTDDNTPGTTEVP